MRKLGLVVVILVYFMMGNLSSDTSVVPARQSSFLASAAPLSSAVPQAAAEPRSPIAFVSLLNGMIPVHEPTSLFLLGGSLISAGILFRRRIRP